MSGGTFSGPPRKRPLRSANARGSAPFVFSRLVGFMELRILFCGAGAPPFGSAAPF
jgi:hypothetical protein